ncbi:MAG: hypothetical protein P4M13_02175 [Alphaproteobacteria bacterium]|nr:hypothetical protein [Alphaproteobacteria bacterium]
MLSRLLLVLFLALSFAAPVSAHECEKVDDTVSFDLSAEDWVTTKTAHVTLSVEASVSGDAEGSMRADMAKAVNAAAKADWRETGFARSQDQAGMERWSVVFDARLPESALNGLANAVKKSSKAGMQITVGDIDFNPTADEVEASRAALRAHILKEAGEQLAALNTTLPGRAYRIAQVTFGAESPPLPFRVMQKSMMAPAAMAATDSGDQSPAQDHAQKLILKAHVVYAALPPIAAPSAH